MAPVDEPRATEGRPPSPLTFRGLLGRGAFAISVVVWHVVVGVGAGMFALFVVLPWLSLSERSADGVVLGFGALVFVAYAVGMASFAVRRLRDLGRGGAWVVLGFVPLVNLVLLVVLLVAPGSRAREAEASPEDSAGWTGGWNTVASTLEANREAAAELHAAAYEEGRRFAERSGRRPPNDDAGVSDAGVSDARFTDPPAPPATRRR